MPTTAYIYVNHNIYVVVGNHHIYVVVGNHHIYVVVDNHHIYVVVGLPHICYVNHRLVFMPTYHIYLVVGHNIYVVSTTTYINDIPKLIFMSVVDVNHHTYICRLLT